MIYEMQTSSDDFEGYHVVDVSYKMLTNTSDLKQPKPQCTRVLKCMYNQTMHSSWLTTSLEGGWLIDTELTYTKMNLSSFQFSTLFTGHSSRKLWVIANPKTDTWLLILEISKMACQSKGYQQDDQTFSSLCPAIPFSRHVMSNVCQHLFTVNRFIEIEVTFSNFWCKAIQVSELNIFPAASMVTCICTIWANISIQIFYQFSDTLIPFLTHFGAFPWKLHVKTCLSLGPKKLWSNKKGLPL